MAIAIALAQVDEVERFTEILLARLDLWTDVREKIEPELHASLASLSDFLRHTAAVAFAIGDEATDAETLLYARMMHIVGHSTLLVKEPLCVSASAVLTQLE
jgi:hypothetical protein